MISGISELPKTAYHTNYGEFLHYPFKGIFGAFATKEIRGPKLSIQ